VFVDINNTNNYPTMKLNDICTLPVSKLAEKDCVLFLWATYPRLVDAIEVIKAWGFTYKTVAFTWVKRNKKWEENFRDYIASSHYDAEFNYEDTDDYQTREDKICEYASKYFMGMGRWTRSNAEICILASRGNPKRINASVRGLIDTPIERHSKKPDCIYKRIEELMGDLPRIELFVRQTKDGWDCWGNDKNVINTK